MSVFTLGTTKEDIAAAYTEECRPFDEQTITKLSTEELIGEILYNAPRIPWDHYKVRSAVMVLIHQKL